MQAPKCQHGFTLFEMLAVIVLIGIAVAAVSIPVTQGLASARVAAASTEMAAALRYTRTQAIVQGNEKRFVVDVRGNTYQATGKADVSLPQGMRVAITSAQEDRISDTRAAIRFFPDGSSTGGRITLIRGSREWHVNVAWLTGAISVVAP
jgi:general secretion pathway protein H